VETKVVLSARQWAGIIVFVWYVKRSQIPAEG
jgi:hypothetical protein